VPQLFPLPPNVPVHSPAHTTPPHARYALHPRTRLVHVAVLPARATFTHTHAAPRYFTHCVILHALHTGGSARTFTTHHPYARARTRTYTHRLRCTARFAHTTTHRSRFTPTAVWFPHRTRDTHPILHHTRSTQLLLHPTRTFILVDDVGTHLDPTTHTLWFEFHTTHAHGFTTPHTRTRTPPHTRSPHPTVPTHGLLLGYTFPTPLDVCTHTRVPHPFTRTDSPHGYTRHTTRFPLHGSPRTQLFPTLRSGSLWDPTHTHTRLGSPLWFWFTTPHLGYTHLRLRVGSHTRCTPHWVGTRTPTHTHTRLPTHTRTHTTLVWFRFTSPLRRLPTTVTTVTGLVARYTTHTYTQFLYTVSTRTFPTRSPHTHPTPHHVHTRTTLPHYTLR